MSNTQYYKGYTLHQVNSNSRDDDSDETAVRKMELIPGLYTCKHIGQEGLVLPVCKYINNKLYKSVHEFDAAAETYGSHSRYSYARIDNDKIVLSNSVIIPKYILGGIVMLNNLMLSHRGKDVLDEDNLIPLISSKHINMIREYRDKDELVGIMMRINRNCILETKLLRFVFEFSSDENGYTDLKTTTYMK